MQQPIKNHRADITSISAVFNVSVAEVTKLIHNKKNPIILYRGIVTCCKNNRRIYYNVVRYSLSYYRWGGCAPRIDGSSVCSIVSVHLCDWWRAVLFSRRIISGAYSVKEHGLWESLKPHYVIYYFKFNDRYCANICTKDISTRMYVYVRRVQCSIFH